MFLTVAWLRLFLFALLLFPGIYSREDTLFTSSVTYCEDPETILIHRFHVAYLANNQSVYFNISAASVEPNVNVSLNIFLNVYGMHPVNFTVDLCSVFAGVLCPLPMYNFTGSDTIRLPRTVDIQSKIPTIAFRIPDLETFAQVTLIETGTGNVKACVQATLSNGWSARQSGVEWGVRAFALLAFLSALWQSRRPDSLAPSRFVDMFYLFQAIASSALLNLNYPSVYRAFTLNFAWAMGLVYSSPIQAAITHMRHVTGASVSEQSDAYEPAVSWVNRKLSPYNVVGATNALSLPPPMDLLAMVNDTGWAASLPQLQAGGDDIGEVVTVTTTSSNVLEAGIPIYVNSIGLPTANGMVTILFTTLMLASALVIASGLGYACSRWLLRPRKNDWDRWSEVYLHLVRAWALRFCLVLFTPVLVFTFYQWTLRDSGLSVLLSVCFALVIVASVGVSSYATLRLAVRSSAHVLYEPLEPPHKNGPLYAHYRAPRYYFFLPLLIASFIKALVIAFAKYNSIAQITLFMLVELCLLVTHLVLRPYQHRGGDILATYLTLTRFVAATLMLTFIERLALKPILRVAIGIVIAIMFSVAVLVVFINCIQLLIQASPLRLSLQARPPRLLVKWLPSRSESLDDSTLERGIENPLEKRIDTPLQMGIGTPPVEDTESMSSRPPGTSVTYGDVADPLVLQPYHPLDIPLSPSVKSERSFETASSLGSVIKRSRLSLDLGPPWVQEELVGTMLQALNLRPLSLAVGDFAPEDGIGSALPHSPHTPSTARRGDADVAPEPSRGDPPPPSPWSSYRSPDQTLTVQPPPADETAIPLPHSPPSSSAAPFWRAEVPGRPAEEGMPERVDAPERTRRIRTGRVPA